MIDAPDYEVRRNDDNTGILILDGGVEVMTIPYGVDTEKVFELFIVGVKARGGSVFNMNAVKCMEPGDSV